QIDAARSSGVHRQCAREHNQRNPRHELHSAVPVLQRCQFECGAHDAERGECAQAGAQQVQRVGPPRVAHLRHGSSTDTIWSTVWPAGLYLARFSRNFAKPRSSVGYGRYSTTSAAHRLGLETPAAFSADAMTSSLAVLADTFCMFASWSPGAGSVGSATWMSAARLTGEAVCTAAPPAASDTLRTAAPIAARTGL